MTSEEEEKGVRALPEKLLEAHRQAARPLSRDEIAKIVAGVVNTMDGDVRSTNVRLYSELDSIARYIKDAKNEIAQIQPAERPMNDIANASDELDAVVDATEEATGSILDAAELIENVVPHLEGTARDQIVEGVTRIYEACNFQDITGQRIAKVVRTIKHLEDRIDELLMSYGKSVAVTREADDARREALKSLEDDGEAAKLLNGPALPGSAIDQDEIDKLLADLDN